MKNCKNYKKGILPDITWSTCQHDFCSFWCVAVNTVDKLQFLSFIFAFCWILKTQNFIWRGPEVWCTSPLQILSKLAHQSQRYYDCLISQHHCCRHLDFLEFTKFYWLNGLRGLKRTLVPNFVKIGQSIAKILLFFYFLFFEMAAAAIFFCIFRFAKFY